MFVVLEENLDYEIATRIYEVADEATAAFIELCEAIGGQVMLIAPQVMSIEPDDPADLHGLEVFTSKDQDPWAGLSRAAIELLLSLARRRLDNPNPNTFFSPASTDLTQVITLAYNRLAELDGQNSGQALDGQNSGESNAAMLSSLIQIRGQKLLTEAEFTSHLVRLVAKMAQEEQEGLERRSDLQDRMESRSG